MKVRTGWKFKKSNVYNYTAVDHYQVLYIRDKKVHITVSHYVPVLSFNW